MLTVLETKRLILVPRCEADNAPLQPLFSDWEIIKNLTETVPWPYPEDGMETYWHGVLGPAMEAGTEMCWTLRLRTDPDAPMGQINLRPPGVEDQRGFWLGRPYWGQGFMQEAADEVTRYAFEVLGYEKLSIPTRDDNAASNRIKENQGFRIVQRAMKRYAGGFEHESLIWELTRMEYFERLKSKS